MCSDTTWAQPGTDGYWASSLGPSEAFGGKFLVQSTLCQWEIESPNGHTLTSKLWHCLTPWDSSHQSEPVSTVNYPLEKKLTVSLSRVTKPEGGRMTFSRPSWSYTRLKSTSAFRTLTCQRTPSLSLCFLIWGMLMISSLQSGPQRACALSHLSTPSSLSISMISPLGIPTGAEQAPHWGAACLPTHGGVPPGSCHPPQSQGKCKECILPLCPPVFSSMAISPC